MGEYKGYTLEEGEVEPGKYGILIYDSEEAWRTFSPVDTAWDEADAKRKIDEGRVLGKLFPVQEELRGPGTFRLERTTVDRVIDDLERTWYRIAQDMDLRMQSALGILKEVMGHYYEEPCTVAWDNSDLVGIVVYETAYNYDYSIRDTHIKELASFTHEPGVGRLLVEEVVRIGREEDSDIVSAAHGPGAREFYEKLGFVKNVYYPQEPTLMMYRLKSGQSEAKSPDPGIILSPVSPVEPHILDITYEGRPLVGTLITEVKGDSLVVHELAVDRPSTVTKEFMFALGGALEAVARQKGLTSVKIKYFPQHLKMYELAGFTQSYEEGESSLVVRRVGGGLAQYGTCYEDAWRFLIKEEEGYLIHGSVQLSEGGPRVNHAWVELPTGWVWEPQTKDYYTIEDFKMMSPIEEHRYTVEEAAIMLARVGRHGPWTGEERRMWL